jgi:y4mF family transcriptional regulator
MRVRTSTDVGAVIRDRRQALGLTQAALAEKVGVSRKWIVDVERGKPRAALRWVLRTLEALGIVLDVGPPPPRRANVKPLPGANVDLEWVLKMHRKR